MIFIMEFIFLYHACSSKVLYMWKTDQLNIYNEYLTQLKQGEEPNKVMDSLKITRYCCRRMFVSSVETIYQVIPYYGALRKRRAEIQSRDGMINIA